MNIDFGSTPPADTSKLWVPLATKPSNISLQTGVDVGDFASKTINIVDTNGNQASIPQYSGIADDGNGGWYCFGGGAGAGSYYGRSSNFIWHISRSGVLTKLTETLVHKSAGPVCIRSSGDIYIFGGTDSTTYYNVRGFPMIQKFNISSKTTTLVWKNDTKYETSAGGPWNGAKVFKWKEYIILCGGSWYSGDPMISGSSGSYGGNAIRFFKPSTNEFVGYRILSGEQYQYSTLVCAIAENTVAAADTGETKGYLYNVETKTAEIKIPYFGGHARSFATESSIPMHFLGNSYTLASDGNIYEYFPERNHFAETASKQVEARPNPYAYGCGYNDGYAYVGSGNKLYEIALKTPLNDNNMIIALDIQGTAWKALNTKDTQASVYPIKVLVGDTDGWAVQKDAYLYNTTTNKWTKLDGSSTYQDMLNALNIMGVN